MKRKIAIGFSVFLIAVLMSACSSTPTPGPVFSVQMEPGFDGYYVQSNKNEFIPLEEILRTSFKENIMRDGAQYKFCETYGIQEFLKITNIENIDYRVNTVKGDSGRKIGNDYRLYKITRFNDSETDPKNVTLCAQEIESKLAVFGTTTKVKPVSPIEEGIFYIKDEKWFVNNKSRFFILFLD
jgi:hypothetical protein